MKKSNNSKPNIKLILILSCAVIVLFAVLVGGLLYQHNHIYSSYGPNAAGNITIDKKKIPKGWNIGTVSPATNAVTLNISTMLSKPNEDGLNLYVQKVTNSSMKFNQASTLSAKLRSDKTQLLKNAGFGINVLPASSVVFTINSKKVRLPTVEYSEYYSDRIEESDAFYVQDGYYIDIERQVVLNFDPHPNHTELIGMFNNALTAFSISK